MVAMRKDLEDRVNLDLEGMEQDLVDFRFQMLEMPDFSQILEI
jgi:hypothetical protein